MDLLKILDQVDSLLDTGGLPDPLLDLRLALLEKCSCRPTMAVSNSLVIIITTILSLCFAFAQFLFSSVHGGVVIKVDNEFQKVLSPKC